EGQVEVGGLIEVGPAPEWVGRHVAGDERDVQVGFGIVRFEGAFEFEPRRSCRGRVLLAEVQRFLVSWVVPEAQFEPLGAWRSRAPREVDDGVRVVRGGNLRPAAGAAEREELARGSRT